ncbi:RNA polymerase sigma-70 factor [Mucilaginibacter sp. RS28]|uniref:RNA polymerase sigma-70 factor n=1 Tax=Mucilaginibacter straminoryzae TaxID=2932774 RepID=A0A9X1X0Q1_9SPHI|nr:RNA polymerase sigma-70 factor [Mucilaginibacter straminoryzae]MCJ8208491.1 RNA polymerase sigma-70 factor [Mucilaginibacter straminoryzae]
MRGFNLKEDFNFDEIFEAYKHQVYMQVYAIAKSEYAAEELTQEIFIKLWLNKDALKDVKNMGGYIYTIVRNYSLNYLRKAASDTRLVNELLRTAVPCSNELESFIDASECKKLISKAVSQLSPQRQLVYKLSREEGLSYDEIAGKLNLSKNTVKNHLVAALSYINAFLVKNDVNPTLVAILTLSFIKLF